jgi:flagellar basal-body rod protein FlgB
MGLIPTQLLKQPQRTLSLVSARQEALADNIANMHTVGYRRKDVDFSQYLNSDTSSNMEAKLTDKFGASPISSSVSNEKLNPEDEMALMQQNYMYYAVAVRQLSSTITQIKTAMNVSANA